MYNGDSPVHVEHVEPAMPTDVEPVSRSITNCCEPIVSVGAQNESSGVVSGIA
jgi:hypothetical protein